MYKIVETSIDDKKNAQGISKYLLDNKMAACIQITKSMSYYNWKEKLSKSKEYIIKIKTSSKLVKKVSQYIMETHSYENPEIISYDIDVHSKEYEKWYKANIK